MLYTVKTIPNFDREMKRLAKKYVSLKQEYKQLVAELEKNPKLGTHLGNDIYKIRLAIASKGKGKSGGARVITHFYIENNAVFLLAIYDKNEQANISDKDLKELLTEIE